MAMAAFAYAERVHVYNCQEGGFVVLDEQQQVVALSYEGDASTMSEGLRTFLENSEMELVYEQERMRAPKERIVKDSVGPILGGIMFDQGAPYNRQTPMYRSQHCLTGCVATAMAQIMTFYRHPQVCSPGAIEFTTEDLKIKVYYDFTGVSFDWDKILPTYINGANKNYTDEQADEVAKLMAACGASVKMNYNVDASGAFSDNVPEALAGRFGYKAIMEYEYRADYVSDVEFQNLMKAEFNIGRPIFMAGSNPEGGHAYVCDGYLTYEGAEDYPLFHFNWGWNGYGNEWVMLNKSGYNQTMRIVRNIIPNDGQGVEAVENTATVDTRIFNLLGQEVATTVPGMIYVQGGKKFIAQ